MENTFFDLRKLSVEGFLGEQNIAGSGSFVGKKYSLGRPNSSFESTLVGSSLSLSRMLSKQDDDAFFGVHIRETIREFKTLFGKR